MLTNKQKHHFVTEGYVQVPVAIPAEMIDAARRAVNHSIGTVGMGGENADAHRSAYSARGPKAKPNRGNTEQRVT